FEEFHISFYNFVATNIFKEISKRFFISVNQLYLMTIYEILDLLDGKALDFAELNKRKDFALIIRHENERFVLSGEHAKTIFGKYFKKEKIKFKGLLNGQTAFPGKAKGIVKLFYHPSHVYEFKEGQIMITAQTNPIYVPAMKKAGAIVTDEGGVTCHAAIVSRELGIPCIIGTKIATRVFNNGDLVEVDSEKGLVKLLKKAKK
ncbi:MAG: PEP-utilizing enzyme, partial [Candidatus Diapherotrites archaeon]|nr:PEP-utilizing enzyme [Candidatus Diapherotrites archaeon]